MGAVVTRDKLAAVLGLLGSSYDNEVLVAARTAERLRRQMGVAWADLLVDGNTPAVQEGSASPFRPGGRRASDQWRQTWLRCFPRATLLNEFEHRFLLSLAGFTHISQKQARVLAEIASKLGVAA